MFISTWADMILKIKKKTSKTTPKGTSWYYSSISIANKIVKSLDSVPGFKKFKLSAPKYESKMFYYRGDEEVMSKIAELFSIAKGSKVSKKDLKIILLRLKILINGILQTYILLMQQQKNL